VQVVVVAVTNVLRRVSCLLLFLVVAASGLKAAVLPVDRADALYHYYDGGGVTIQGPSILVRKSFKDKISVSANYYVDNVSSASIDVVTTASKYTEERTETSVGIDYLTGKTIVSMNYTQSEENDFSARSAHIDISQDFFGDLTTLSMGFSQGWDVVGKRGEPEFSREADRRHYRVGLSQVITKNSLLSMSIETITDEGFLNNPYRSVRYLDPGVPVGYSFQPEVYPNTRTSDSVALRGIYYLPYRAAVKFEAKGFSDTWGIKAKTLEFGYVHALGDEWTFDFKVRYYDQGQADFFADLFPQADAQNFMARDKEMSAFTSTSAGFGVTWEKQLPQYDWIEKYSVNFYLDYYQFDYEQFRDLTVTATPGTEPFYNFEANVIRAYFSVYY